MKKNVVMLKAESLIVSFVSLLTGIQLILFPTILNSYRIYEVIREIFDNYLIGSILVILGLLKIYGVYMNNQWIKNIGRYGMLFTWLLFLIAFLFTPPPNTLWIQAITCVLLIVVSMYKEVKP